jgi:hypothetical protein
VGDEEEPSPVGYPIELLGPELRLPLHESADLGMPAARDRELGKAPGAVKPVVDIVRQARQFLLDLIDRTAERDRRFDGPGLRGGHDPVERGQIPAHPLGQGDALPVQMAAPRIPPAVAAVFQDLHGRAG